MDVRYFGIIKATINPRKKRVVLTCNRGPAKLPDSTVTQVVNWALAGVDDLAKAGYEIDRRDIDSFFNSDNRNISAKSKRRKADN